MRPFARSLTLSVLLLVACAAPERKVEYLDQTTGATVVSVDTPLVFARPRLELAYGARDYVTLAAASVNRSGHIEQVLIGYVWSTVDPRMRRDPEPADQTLIIVADDRAILLSADRRTSRDAGIAAPVAVPAGSNATQRLYPTDVATLRFLAAARQLRLTLKNGSDPRPFELWVDGRSALLQFLGGTARD